MSIEAVDSADTSTSPDAAEALVLLDRLSRVLAARSRKVVELDEIARYVEAWTGEWVRRTSGGRSRQRPVVWKLGQGRVPTDRIPQGIAILRLAPKPAAAKPKPAPLQEGAGEAAPSAAPES